MTTSAKQNTQWSLRRSCEKRAEETHTHTHSRSQSRPRHPHLPSIPLWVVSLLPLVAPLSASLEVVVVILALSGPFTVPWPFWALSPVLCWLVRPNQINCKELCLRKIVLGLSWCFKFGWGSLSSTVSVTLVFGCGRSVALISTCAVFGSPSLLHEQLLGPLRLMMQSTIASTHSTTAPLIRHYTQRYQVAHASSGAFSTSFYSVPLIGPFLHLLHIREWLRAPTSRQIFLNAR